MQQNKTNLKCVIVDIPGNMPDVPGGEKKQQKNPHI